MRPTRRAIGGSEDPGVAAVSAVGAALGLAEAEAGIGVTPHGYFKAFVVAAAPGSPPGVREPFTVIIWGTVSVREVTENVRLRTSLQTWKRPRWRTAPPPRRSGIET